MNKFSMNAALVLALTFTSFFVVLGAAFAADHGSHGSNHGRAQATEQKAQIYTATGTINSLEKAGLKATIMHDPVPALGWPTMTMGFAFEDATLLEGLKAGDKVRFDFRVQGNTPIIVDIEIRK